MSKKLITVFVLFVIIFNFSACSSNGGSIQITSNYKSIEDNFVKNNFSVKAVSNYSNDFIANVDGYQFKINDYDFIVLQMPQEEFELLDMNSNLKINNSEVYISKNVNKPYIIYINKNDTLQSEEINKILECFEAMEIDN